MAKPPKQTAFRNEKKNYLFICLCMCMQCTCYGLMWRSGNNPGELIRSYCIGPGI